MNVLAFNSSGRNHATIDSKSTNRLAKQLPPQGKEITCRSGLGYELNYTFPQPTPMILALSIHYSRATDLIIPDYVTTDPPETIGGYRDSFGSWCTRLAAPRGLLRIKTDALIRDTGEPDKVVPDAWQHPVQDLPEETLVFLLGSRYCETDLLSETAWRTFGETQPGWQRVQAICDYVHHCIAFDYQQARPTRTAWQALNERTGAPCHRLLPLHEYSGALLHRLSGRYGDAAALRRGGFCGLV
jgi:hypothetical protein